MKSSILVSLLLIGSATADTPLYSNNTISTIHNDNNIDSELGFSVENIRLDPTLAIKTNQYDVSTAAKVLATYTSDYVSPTNTVQNVTTISTSESAKSTANSTINQFDLPLVSNITATEYVNTFSNRLNISSEYISNITSSLQDDSVYSNFTSTALTVASPTTISTASNNTILDRKYPNITSASIVRGGSNTSSVISSIQTNSNTLQASNISSTSPWANNTGNRNTSDHFTSVIYTAPFSTINTSPSINAQFRNSSTSVDVTYNTSSTFYHPSVTGAVQFVNSSAVSNTTRTSSSSDVLSYNPNYSNFTLPNKEVNQTMTNILTPISTPQGSETQILQNSSISTTKVPSYNLSTASIKSSLHTDPTSSVKLPDYTSTTNSSSRTLTFTEENYTSAVYYNQTTTSVKINNISVNNTYITQGNRSTIIASIRTTSSPSSSSSSSIHYFTNSTLVNYLSQPNSNISSSSISITGKNDAAVPTGNIKQPSSALVNSSTSIQVILTSSSTIEIFTETPFTQINSTEPLTTRINTLPTVASSSDGFYRNSSSSQISSISSSNEIITTGGNKAIDPISATLLPFSNASDNITSTSIDNGSITSATDPSNSLDAATATGTQVSNSSLPKLSFNTKKNDVGPTATLISESHSLNTNTASSPTVINLSQITTSNAATTQTIDENSSKHTQSTFRYDIDPTAPVVNNTSSYHKSLRHSSELANSETHMKPSTTVTLITSNTAAQLQPSSKSIIIDDQSSDFNKLVKSSSTVETYSNKITENDKSTSSNVVATTKGIQRNEVTTDSGSVLCDTHTAMQNDSDAVTSTTSASTSHIITASNIKETGQINSVISSSDSSKIFKNVGSNGSNDVNANNVNPSSAIESNSGNLSTSTATTQLIEPSITITSERDTATVLTGSFTTASTLVRPSTSASSTHSTIEYSDSASNFSTHSWFTVIIFIFSYIII